MKTNLTILGGGNLGTAIAQGLATSDVSDQYKITITRRHVSLIKHLEEHGICVTNDNRAAVREANLVILAVQPQQLHGLLSEISDQLDANQHTLISVITGVKAEDITSQIGSTFKVVRAMPNTAIAISQSMTCITSSPHKEALEQTIRLFDALGETLVIDDHLMEAATVLGACGIAFFLRFIRAASQGGIEVGFHADEAQLIASQTALGAASLLLNSEDHPEQAIDRVTTPRGCTIAGLNEMEHNGLSSALIKGIKTSYEKIEKIR